jgi:hypothetical protein
VTQRKPPQRRQHVRFTLSKGERDLLLRRTFLTDEVEKRLRLSTVGPGSRLAADLTLEELDDLAASVAAEANHCDEPRILRELDAIYDRLARLEQQARGPRSRVI